MWAALIPILGPILQRLIPDPAERMKYEADMRAAAERSEAAQLDLIKSQIEAQTSLAIAETSKGTKWDAWRPALAWIMIASILIALVVSPLLEAAIGVSVDVDQALLEKVAGWWMAVYMGGHTIKHVADKAAEAIGGRK